MDIRTVSLSIGLLVAILVGDARALAPDGVYRAMPCKVAPSIDGVDGPGEWDDAKSYQIDLQMSAVKGEASPVRRSELRLMNSAANLYLAFRVPDTARDLEISPLVADIVVLAFCRGEELSEGDDRRVVLPGMYADKHSVSPGKDADDPQPDGNATMRWSAAAGGEHFVEWRWAEQRGVAPAQLTTLKLERLMRRLRGESWPPFGIRPGGKGALIAANQLDYPEAERADVPLGLTAFAKNDACATRLTQSYARLAAEWQVLGPRLGDGTPADTRAALHKLTASPR